MPRPLPELPILSSRPPSPPPVPPGQRTDREKYGGLYWLGLAGLIPALLWVGWFAYSAWSLRALWSDIYVLGDPSRGEEERIGAALRLSRSPDATQRQLWDLTFRTDLPMLGRYLLAESLTAEAARADPRGFALAVARSEGWPDWLRLQMTRVLGLAASGRIRLPAEPLQSLAKRDDPFIRAWALFALAAGPDADPEARAALIEEAGKGGAATAVARELAEALDSSGEARSAHIREATLLLRSDHPGASELWGRWKHDGDRLVPKP